MHDWRFLIRLAIISPRVCYVYILQMLTSVPQEIFAAKVTVSMYSAASSATALLGIRRAAMDDAKVSFFTYSFTRTLLDCLL